MNLKDYKLEIGSFALVTIGAIICIYLHCYVDGSGIYFILGGVFLTGLILMIIGSIGIELEARGKRKKNEKSKN